MSYKGKKGSKVFDPLSGYELYADQYDEDTPYLNGFEKEFLVQMMNDLRGKKVLDLGAGTGRMIHHLRNLGANVVAADLSEKMLKKLHKKYPDIETIVADIEGLPFKDESFDCVLASFVIVHLKYLDKAFEEVYRVLKPGGAFFVTNINQRKAPKLELKDGKEIVIESFYHRPVDVIEELEKCFFKIEKEHFVNEGDVWVNQIIKAVK